MSIQSFDQDMMALVGSMVADKFALVEAGVDVPNAKETKAMIETRKVCFDAPITAIQERIRHKEEVEIPDKEKRITKLRECIQTLDDGRSTMSIDPLSITEFRAPVKFLKDHGFMLSMAKTECSALRMDIQDAEDDIVDLKNKLKKLIVRKYAVMAEEEFEARGGN